MCGSVVFSALVTCLSLDSPSLRVSAGGRLQVAALKRLIPLFISEFRHARYAGNYGTVQVYCHAIRLVVFMIFLIFTLALL